MHTKDILTHAPKKTKRKKRPKVGHGPHGEKRNRAMDALADAKTVPVAAGDCCYCNATIVVYGSKARQNKTSRLPEGKKLPLRNNPIITPNTYDRNIEATKPQPCATCMRDIHYHKQYGRYPKNSPLTELSLYNRSLREDTMAKSISLEDGLERLAEIAENRYITVEQNRTGKWAGRKIQALTDRVAHLNAKLRSIVNELDLDRENYQERE